MEEFEEFEDRRESIITIKEINSKKKEIATRLKNKRKRKKNKKNKKTHR